MLLAIAYINFDDSRSIIGILLLMLVTVLAVDAIWLVARMTDHASLYDPARRQLFRLGLGWAAVGTTAALAATATYQGLRPVEVKPVDVTLGRLPAAFDGLRLVQISDVHIGPLRGGDWLRRIVDQVNGLKPDVIAVTGDLVDGSVEALREHVAPLADLTAPHGVFFITGNHEYYSGVAAWRAHIASLGLRVLSNERVTLSRDGQTVDLAGVEDWGGHDPADGKPDLPAALAGRDPARCLILLAHQPAAIDEAAAHGVDLQLSGHTHGGQLWPFPWLVRLQQPYIKGLHRHRDTATQIYVSSGTGFWGPPMRLGTAAEITVLTLRAVAQNS